MERLWTIIRKEIYHIWRDPRTLGLILALPALLLVLLGYGISGESHDIPMAVVDLSKSDASRRYIEYFTTSKDFALSYDALSENEILRLVDQGNMIHASDSENSFAREIRFFDKLNRVKPAPSRA